MKRIPLNSGFWILVLAVGLIWTLINDLALTQTVSQSNSTEVPSKLDVPVYKMPATSQPSPGENSQNSLAPKFVAPEIVEFLSDQRPIGEMTDKELKKRALQAETFATLADLPAPILAQLQTVITTTQAEIKTRSRKTEDIIEEIPAAAAPADPVVTFAPALSAETTVPNTPATVSPEVIVIFQDQRPLSAMTVEELATRASKTRRLARQTGMAIAMRERLLGLSEAARAELADRTLSVLPTNRTKLYQKTPDSPTALPNLVSPPPSPTLPVPETTIDTPQANIPSGPLSQPTRTTPPPDLPDFLKQPAQVNLGANNAPVPAPQVTVPSPPVAALALTPEAVQLLSEKRQLTELNGNELTTRFMLARQYAKDNSLPADKRRALSLASEAARQELERRATAPHIAMMSPPPDRVLTENPATIPSLVKPISPTVAPNSSMPDFLSGASITPAAPSLPPPTPAVNDTNAKSEAEQRAQNFIATDKATAQALSYSELRQRLDEMRKILAANQLSPQTQSRLRQRLGQDRDMLRGRIASATGTTPASVPSLTTPSEKLPVIGRQTFPTETVILGADPLSEPDSAYIPKSDVANNQAPSAPQTMLPLPVSPALPPTLEADRQALAANKLVTGQDAAISAPVLIPPQAVLNDRRTAEQVSAVELVKRLQVYRQAVKDKQFSNDQRSYWKAMMERDGIVLDQHLLTERERRRRMLAAQPPSTAPEIDGITIFNDMPPAATINATEVSDKELLEYLTTSPSLQPSRNFYTVSQVEASPGLRHELPHIDMDTLYFGFNEAILRPEEVANLNRLGILMERILSRFPGETFFIEGHTDAVGSEAANLRLSRQRAEAVKQALSRYFVIPEKNLIAVGYGERELKIPTNDAEAENRRVSISRATPLIGPVQN